MAVIFAVHGVMKNIPIYENSDIEKNENSSSEYYAVQNSSFLYATDIDNDNNYEIVLYSYYEESPAYCTIYKYDDLNNTVTKFE